MSKKPRKDDQIVVRVDSDTKKKVIVKAKKKKVKPAEYVRRLIDADINPATN